MNGLKIIIYIGTHLEAEFFARENDLTIHRVEGMPRVICATFENIRGLSGYTTRYMTPNHRNLNRIERDIWELCHSRYLKFTGEELRATTGENDHG